MFFPLHKSIETAYRTSYNYCKTPEMGAAVTYLQEIILYKKALYVAIIPILHAHTVRLIPLKVA